MDWKKGLGSGLIGAGAMTILHQTARKFVPNAPRMDILGMRAIVYSLRGIDVEPPKGQPLYDLTMAGDIVSNAVLFSVVGANDGRHALRNGVLAGIGAGAATVVLPSVLGLGRQPNEDKARTPLLTVAWYLVGGLAAAAACQALYSSNRR